jgi:hypothetical protein
MLNFSRYSLFQNTLLDNYSIIYLVNSKDLINSSTFIKAKINNYILIKAEITSLPIIRYNTYIIKNIINKPIGLYTKDLILYNIISEACLAEKKA